VEYAGYDTNAHHSSKAGTWAKNINPDHILRPTAEQKKSTMPATTDVPSYCQYASGPCDQSFEGIATTDVYFFYSSQPEIIANTIEEGAALLRSREPSLSIKTWRDMPINGQLIFCQICKAQRFTKVAVIDVTTMNFNLMFEIGYALGLGIPVVPIRDTTFTSYQERLYSNQFRLLSQSGAALLPA